MCGGWLYVMVVQVVVCVCVYVCVCVCVCDGGCVLLWTKEQFTLI